MGNLIEALVFPIGYYFLFRKLKLNYAELLTISFYLIANSIFIVFFLVGLPELLINSSLSVIFVVSTIIVYYMYALLCFFKEVPMLKRIIFVFIGLVVFFLMRFLLVPFLLALLFPLGIN